MANYQELANLVELYFALGIIALSFPVIIV